MKLTPRRHLTHHRHDTVSLADERVVGKLIQLGRKAGAAYGSVRADKAYAELVLMDELSDTEREQLGFATHRIAQNKAGGHASSDVWRYVLENLKDRYGRSLKTMDDDTVKIGVLAYSAGICQDDPKVCAGIQRYMNGVAHDYPAHSYKLVLSV